MSTPLLSRPQVSHETAMSRVEQAMRDLTNGRAVLVVDSESRENEGDLIFAAEKATPELVAFVVRFTSGYVCVAIPEDEADRLDLPPMFHTNQDRHHTAYGVAVSAREGLTNGISATDRARTIALMADPAATSADFVRPGRIIPLRARTGGVLARAGHTEAAVDLVSMAGLRPAGALCEVVSDIDPSGMARLPELLRFAADHTLTIVWIADLIEYRLRREVVVRPTGSGVLPIAGAQFEVVTFGTNFDDRQHVAFVRGDVGARSDAPVYIHSECRIAEITRTSRCDCASNLDAALLKIARGGCGVVVYLGSSQRDLAAAIGSCTLSGDGGADLATADSHVAAQIIRALGVAKTSS